MKRVIGAVVVCAVVGTSAFADPTYQVNTETRSESLKKDAYALVVIGGVTFLASAGLAYAAHEKADQISRHDPSQPWEGSDLYLEREGSRLSTLSTLTGVAGGAFLLSSAICYWRSRVAASEEHRVSVAPMATHSSAGIALGGSF